MLDLILLLSLEYFWLSLLFESYVMGFIALN